MNNQIKKALDEIAKSNETDSIKRVQAGKLLIQSVWRATV